MASTRPFEFQRFTVRQDRSAMKVGFDGVLLGAWGRLCSDAILDIGTGTGLVALMAAQRTEVEQPLIDAIEIDRNAILDAGENFAASPWSDRLRLHHGRIQSWNSAWGNTYGSILCNPPFFSGTASTVSSRSVARHDRELCLRDLLMCSHQLLTGTGRLSVIVPVGRLAELESHAEDFDLFTRRTTFVRSLPGKAFHRVLTELSAQAGSCERTELTIETTHHQYSQEFRELTSDFYIPDYRP